MSTRRWPSRSPIDPVKGAEAEVLGESRTLKLKDGGFDDAFGPYEVHLYRLN